MTYKTDYVEVPIDHYGHCPKCDADWAGDDIFETLRQQAWCKDKSDEELRQHVAVNYSQPYRFSRLVGVELPHGHRGRYDGVSYWMCPDCKHQWPRFAKAKGAHSQ